MTTVTQRASAYCLDCEEHEYLYTTDCCQRALPACTITIHRDTSDDGINAVECLPNNGCRKETP